MLSPHTLCGSVTPYLVMSNIYSNIFYIVTYIKVFWLYIIYFSYITLEWIILPMCLPRTLCATVNHYLVKVGYISNLFALPFQNFYCFRFLLHTLVHHIGVDYNYCAWKYNSSYPVSHLHLKHARAPALVFLTWSMIGVAVLWCTLFGSIIILIASISIVVINAKNICKTHKQTIREPVFCGSQQMSEEILKPNTFLLFNAFLLQI